MSERIRRLILGREINQRVMVGDDIVVTVIGLGNQARLMFEAPESVKIDREEVRLSKEFDKSRKAPE